MKMRMGDATGAMHRMGFSLRGLSGHKFVHLRLCSSWPCQLAPILVMSCC